MNNTGLSTVSKDWATKQGYVPYAGPYAAVSERDMLDRAITDIVVNNRDKHAIVSLGGNRVELWILANHYITNIYRKVDEEDPTEAS